MARQFSGIDISLIAAADYSAKQYYFMTATTGGKCTLAGANEKVIGVLQNKPESGEVAIVRVAGTSKVYMGETLTAGEVVTSTAAGDAEQVDGAGEYACGIMLDDAADNNYGNILIIQGSWHASDA